MDEKPKHKRQHTFRVQRQVPFVNEFSTQSEKVADLQGPRRHHFIDEGETKHSKSGCSDFVPVQGPVSSSFVNIRFAKTKTIAKFTPKYEKQDEPESKKRKLSKYPHIPKERTINTRKPVSQFVPIDAWALIFRKCHPSFLLDARLVCRDFNEILKQKSIWKEARISTYGEDMPNCPVPLSELEYANLLAGRGCQIKPCSRRDIKKVYWPFMLRMCDKCLNQAVCRPELVSEEARTYLEFYNEQEREIRDRIPNSLAGLLPAVIMRSGRYAEPRSLNNEETMWLHEGFPGDYCIITDDYDALKAEFAEKVLPMPDFFLFWTRLKFRATLDQMSLARELIYHGYEWPDKGIDIWAKRTFYWEKAEQLDPPMSAGVLRKMVAYHLAMDTASAGTERSWDLLRSKIDRPELRKQAEQLIKWSDEDQNHSDEESLHDQVARHRYYSNPFGALEHTFRNNTPEQDKVIEIAEKALDGLLNVVHDEDVLLMFLDKVRKTYDALEVKPRGLNGDGTMDEYQLTLDDARMIVKDVLLARSGREGTDRYKKITSSLRCIGCTRKGCTRLWTFYQLMVHIRKIHCEVVAKDMHFWKWAMPRQSRSRKIIDCVAWYHIPWPKSFPALPFHRRATTNTVWDPNVEQKYIQHTNENDFALFDSLGANHNTKIAADDFTGNFCRAIRILHESRLNTECVVRIALEYAKRRQPQGSNAHVSVNLSIGQLENLEKAVGTISSRLVMKFKCGLCLQQPNCTIRRRHMLHPQPLNYLITHWKVRHSLTLGAPVDSLLALPSDFELQQTIVREDTELETQKTRAMAKHKQLNASDTEQSLQRAGLDPRTMALLELPSIQSRFDMLFTKSLSGTRYVPYRLYEPEELHQSDEELVEDQEVF